MTAEDSPTVSSFTGRGSSGAACRSGGLSHADKRKNEQTTSKAAPGEKNPLYPKITSFLLMSTPFPRFFICRSIVPAANPHETHYFVSAFHVAPKFQYQGNQVHIFTQDADPVQPVTQFSSQLS
ncbi:MAG: hypothetical protein RBR38_11690 [Desulfomicrobium apsheronum]|nr:hypothetical protein [Desulfomicrobium apsheronum]